MFTGKIGSGLGWCKYLKDSLMNRGFSSAKASHLNDDVDSIYCAFFTILLTLTGMTPIRWIAVHVSSTQMTYIGLAAPYL